MKPEQLAKSGSESSEQCALFAWAALNVGKYPELAWYHSVPNGGARGDDPKTRAIRGMQLKAEGVKNGVSDTFLPVKRGDYSGLYIEMKKLSAKPKKATSRGGVSDEQIAFGKFVQSQGFGFVVCYGWEAARDILISYLES